MKSASVSGVTRGRARIGKEVKEALGSTGRLHHLSYHGSRLTMVEKDIIESEHSRPLFP